jgi:hypothetical protein
LHQLRRVPHQAQRAQASQLPQALCDTLNQSITQTMDCIAVDSSSSRLAQQHNANTSPPAIVQRSMSGGGGGGAGVAGCAISGDTWNGDYSSLFENPDVAKEVDGDSSLVHFVWTRPGTALAGRHGLALAGGENQRKVSNQNEEENKNHMQQQDGCARQETICIKDDEHTTIGTGNACNNNISKSKLKSKPATSSAATRAVSTASHISRSFAERTSKDHFLFQTVAPASSQKSSTWRKLMYNDGTVYEGYTLNGKRHGQGKFLDKSGNRYEGEWRDNLAHGYGFKVFRKDGGRHEGLYLKDKRHGWGMYLWENGDKYIGEVSGCGCVRKCCLWR